MCLNTEIGGANFFRMCLLENISSLALSCLHDVIKIVSVINECAHVFSEWWAKQLHLQTINVNGALLAFRKI